MENEIQVKVKKSEKVLRVPIYDENDKDSGEYLQFDLEDIQTALDMQECIELHKKNIAYLNNQEIIIDKQQDHAGKKLFSSKQEAKAKAIQEFLKREIKALDLFIGEGKTEVILKVMGRRPYLTMFNDISEMLAPIYPYLEQNYKDYKIEIEKKYTKEEDILE